VRFKEGTGSTQVLSWRPRHIEFGTNSPTGGWVMINQFYYPTWKAELTGQAQPAMVRSAMPEGLLEVLAPPGRQDIRVQIPVGFMEYLGRWLSVLSILSALIFGFSDKTDSSRGRTTNVDINKQQRRSVCPRQ